MFFENFQSHFAATGCKLCTMQTQDWIMEPAEKLHPSERKPAAAILSCCPYASLVLIQDLAKHVEVLAPSNSWFVIKIGLSGWLEFQFPLISELKEGQRSPVEVHAANRSIECGFLEISCRKPPNSWRCLR